MYLLFSEEAIAFIEQKYTNRDKKLKFLHDAKGCGCADAGVPTLTFIDEPTTYDVAGQSNYITFYYQPEHAVYYEEQLRVGFNRDYHCLTLSSDAQLYTNGMRLITE